MIYQGEPHVSSMVPFRGDVIVVFSDRTIVRSPSCTRISGDGNSTRVYAGERRVRLVPFRGGVLTAFDDGAVFRSADGNHLYGVGGVTESVYSGHNASSLWLRWETVSSLPSMAASSTAVPTAATWVAEDRRRSSTRPGERVRAIAPFPSGRPHGVRRWADLSES